ncbi:MAG: c-type cytochrome [Campylobacterales bacterium]|nr:c-type cytochrome [Campylobacterales bacterium]
MKKLSTSLIAAAWAAASLMGLQTADIVAKKVNTDLSKISYSADVWNEAVFSEITLFPQTSIALNDKKANDANANAKAKKAKVAAVHNGIQIAFLIKWADGSMNIQSGYKADIYADGFAVQFPSGAFKPDTLPYIGMGSEGRPVVVHLQKAVKSFYEPNGKGNVYYQLNPNQTELFNEELDAYNKKVKAIGSNDYEKAFIAEGFRSTTEIKDGTDLSYARLGYKTDGWMGSLSRSLKDVYVDLNHAAIPVAFAVWDGEKLGRDGLKHLTSWLSVSLEGNGDGSALIAAIQDASGDVAAGKEAVATNGCAGCHQVEATDAPNYMGPSLSNIGGYATASYLRESILSPSSVVVPGYNRNAHSNYMWYTEENGKRVSTMTDYSWLDAQTLENMVAYLQTLKAEVE